MNTQEKIKQLEAEIAKLKEQTEFEEWDWVAIDKHNFLFRITDIDEYNNVRGYGFDFDQHDPWEDGAYWAGIKDIEHKATPEEIEQALIKEAKRRGFPAKIWRHPYLSCDFINPELENYWTYNIESDELNNNCGLVYRQGNWAEIIEDTITVNGYDAEFKDGYVQFGCAKIDNEVFDIHEELEVINIDHTKNGNRKIEAIKIGEGLFTIEQIKQIAERIQ